MIKKDILKQLFLVGMSMFFVISSHAESVYFTQGALYFRQNKPSEAIPLLQNAINEGEDPKAYVYLSLCFYQLGKYTDAMNVCIAGMAAQGTNKKILSFNAGNIAYAMEDYVDAERWYTTSIVGDTTYAPPVLNRANARLRLGKLKESKEDYERYLLLYPETPQYEPITEILRLLGEEIAAIEAEEAARTAKMQGGGGGSGGYSTADMLEAARLEGERRAAEAFAAAEEARRQKLIDDVAASLQNTDTENMSAGAEGTVGYGYESELE